MGMVDMDMILGNKSIGPLLGPTCALVYSLLSLSKCPIMVEIEKQGAIEFMSQRETPPRL